MTSASRQILEEYLGRIGLSRPADAALQIQVTLLRQWTAHLEYVLEAEDVPRVIAERIIRGTIYGGAPNLAEEEIRSQMTAEMIILHENYRIPRFPP